MRKFFEFALPAFLSVVLFGITVFVFILPRMETAIIASKRETTRELVRSIEYILGTYQADVDKGLISLTEAQARAMRRIHAFRYGTEGNNYFWISDLIGRVRMHPTRPDLIDRDLASLTDQIAKRLITEIVQQIHRQKNGFIEYQWKERQDADQSHPKVAYISLFEPWGWIIGSGLYYEDARQETATMTKHLTMVSLGILAVVALLSGYLAWRGLTDAKERQSAEAALQQSEQRFRKLFMMAPMPMAEISRDQIIVQVNDQFKAVLGYDVHADASMARWWERAYPDPEYRQSVITRWQAAVECALQKNDLVEADEYRVTCEDGEERTMLVGASIIGEKMLVSFLDITDHKQAEAARLENLERLRATLNATPDGMLVVTHEGVITHANQQFYKMWQIPESLQQENDQKKLVDFVKHQFQDPDVFLAKVEALRESNTAEDFSEIRFKDGRVFERYSYPTILNHKEIGHVIYYRDITERKQSEIERQTLQEQLLQSLKLEAVGVLAGGVAHDFNNMLGAIIGYSEMALNKIEAANPLYKNLNRIHEAAHRSANLTRQLLAFARKQTVAPMVFNLNDSVGSMLKMLHRLIGENIQLEWLPASVPCQVKMDPGQLDQILANLCVNARDAIADVGMITIKTDLVSFDAVSCNVIIDCLPGDYVQLTVSDNGCGIDPESATHIFEPFYTTKGLGRGTGLGLSTVYGIVKQNNGFIKFYSEPEIGTTFNIYLPHHFGDNTESLSPHAEDIPQGRGETILMVEDDPILQEMGTLMLSHLGYTVLSAAKPSAAIDLVEENREAIRLFITDVVMPEMNGRELAERLHQICPEMRHLFMSGYTANIIVDRGILDEGINFIQKPFSLKDLAVKIRMVLDRPSPP